MTRAIFVDTSAFHALQNKGQRREHALALTTAQELESEPALLVTTDYVLDETYTLLRLTLGHGAAVQFGREIRHGGIQIIQVDDVIQREAWQIFERYSDKDFSFTDCTSFATMRRGGIAHAFTLDRHFQQYGFSTYPRRLVLRSRK